PSACGETLLHTSSRSVPSSPIRSNFFSARRNASLRCGSGSPSKSRNGCSAQMRSPRSPHMRATSRAEPSKQVKSFSKISTASKPAAAIVLSFSSRAPPIETVAIEWFMLAAPAVIAVLSIVNLRDLAQFIRRGGAETEEFEIGRDLLEQHVGADLVVAAFRTCRGQKRRDLFFHDDLADKGLRRDAFHIQRQRIVLLHAERRGGDDDL